MLSDTDEPHAEGTWTFSTGCCASSTQNAVSDYLKGVLGGNMAGIYDSQMQRIHDIAKALDEAGQLEQRQRGGNMEQYFIERAQKLDGTHVSLQCIVYRRVDV